MKLSKEKSDIIYSDYLKLRSDKNKKISHIRREIENKYGLKRTTAYDHTRGRELGSISYKIFSEPIQVEENNVNLRKPKILLFDLETMASLGWTWGPKHETSVIEFENEWFILSCCYKWYGEDDVHSVCLPDFKEYKYDKENDYFVVKKIWELFNEADILIAHNCDKFDLRKAYARFLYHGFPPPSPSKTIDTLKVARKYFSMNSNKLDDIGKYLGLGRKIVHTGWDLWKRCYNGDLMAWNDLIEYNKMDVILLESVYNVFKPYIVNHPNYNIYQNTTHSCPSCGGNNLQKRGMYYNRVTKAQRYQCKDCGAWSQGNKFAR